MSCLVVDAGHTRVKFAACRQQATSSLPEVIRSAAVIYGEPIDWSAIASWFAGSAPRSVIVMGTNLDRAQQVIQAWPAALPRPTLFSDKRTLPLKVDVEFPDKVGMDRLLNAVAANLLRRPDQPAITVGTGTAITVDVIDADGVFRGGAIFPGILLGAKSLHMETTTLPHVNVWELLKTEPTVVGKNTEQAIASGLYWGHLGGIRELIMRHTAWLQTTCSVPPLVLLTGGASGIVAPYLQDAKLETELSLRALAAVADQVTAP
ncbi:type III pantothenate kinase [Planctomicrobium piriforme]|uniref:Type III pantothenate kinase n=1 Tax=Planctomicrobium piriforme TaxID=1576369 RepID=A0A1I3C0C1_9PLAN|nr:type III pantothenate kinase [Planctomicrobium piriforme]SFH67997.1 type III pantothenate kinase [Planctomicrobium piriforme]